MSQSKVVPYPFCCLISSHLPLLHPKEAFPFTRHNFAPEFLAPILILTFTYPLRAMWHIRPTNQLCQLLQFVPHSSSSIQLFPFLSLPSFSMLSCGLPHFRRPSGVQVNAVLQSLFGSFLMMWPMNFHLLLHTFPLRFSISAICRTSLFVIISCQCILNIRLRHLLWKTSILFPSLLFIFHVSQPYMHQDWFYQCLI